LILFAIALITSCLRNLSTKNIYSLTVLCISSSAGAVRCWTIKIFYNIIVYRRLVTVGRFRKGIHLDGCFFVEHFEITETKDVYTSFLCCRIIVKILLQSFRSNRFIRHVLTFSFFYRFLFEIAFHCINPIYRWHSIIIYFDCSVKNKKKLSTIVKWKTNCQPVVYGV